MEADQKLTFINSVLNFFRTVTNMAMVRNFDIVSNQFNLALPCLLKRLIESRRHKFFRDFVICGRSRRQKYVRTVCWTHNVCKPELRYGKRWKDGWKGLGGSKKSYAQSLPLLPCTPTGWPPTCLFLMAK
jgi:hypothetical protein